MSETGYKSLFLPFGEVEANGGVIAYVARWLDAAASSLNGRRLSGTAGRVVCSDHYSPA